MNQRYKKTKKNLKKGGVDLTRFRPIYTETNRINAQRNRRRTRNTRVHPSSHNLNETTTHDHPMRRRRTNGRVQPEMPSERNIYLGALEHSSPSSIETVILEYERTPPGRKLISKTKHDRSKYNKTEYVNRTNIVIHKMVDSIREPIYQLYSRRYPRDNSVSEIDIINVTTNFMEIDNEEVYIAVNSANFMCRVYTKGVDDEQEEFITDLPNYYIFYIRFGRDPRLFATPREIEKIIKKGIKNLKESYIEEMNLTPRL